MWRICGMEDDNNKSPTSHVSNGYLCLHDLSVLISHHMYVLGYYLFFLSFGSPVQTDDVLSTSHHEPSTVDMATVEVKKVCEPMQLEVQPKDILNKRRSHNRSPTPGAVDLRRPRRLSQYHLLLATGRTDIHTPLRATKLITSNTDSWFTAAKAGSVTDLHLPPSTVPSPLAAATDPCINRPAVQQRHHSSFPRAADPKQNYRSTFSCAIAVSSGNKLQKATKQKFSMQN
ncbi:hypothetical protein NC652_034212 [Populus alba x Populus x berolinensis]|nr:hypothetical protein NC652_034212 [Populus alba x Populus x berolinensis]